MAAGDAEQLRELLLDLEQARVRERAQRERYEALLAGLEVLLVPRARELMFHDLLRVLQRPLQFEEAFVLAPNAEGALTTLASTHPRFRDARWRPGAFFERVLGGSTRAVFDIGRIEEWQAQDEDLRQSVTSALHVPLRGEQEIAVLVCTHSARGRFGRDEVELAQQLSALASNALVQLDLRRALALTEAQRRADRERAEQLVLLNEELQRARDAAIEASQTKSAFLANMSHELRTPLNAIIGYSEMLQEDLDQFDLDVARTDIANIHQAGTHLLELINNLLDLSRIEAGKMEIYIETFELAPFIEDIAATIRPLAQRNNNTLHILRPETSLAMTSDRTKVRQILFNLLSNACKFTEHGSVSLEIEADATSDALRFTVTDTGLGMTEEQLERVFEPFTQADASVTRRFGGTGLGLDISRRLTQLLGGQLQAQSQLGAGSRFSAHLPCQLALTASTTPRPAVATPDTLTTSAPRVLSIDDDPHVHDILRRLLVPRGFHVFHATNGEEGLQLAHQVRPDVITLDIMMPGMSGWEVLTLLKSTPGLSAIPVVLVTIVDEVLRGLRLGAAGHLTKPIDRERLLELIGSLTHTDEARCVLVVEDDPLSRELIRRTLEPRGWKVYTAEHGRAALEALEHLRPGLILLDLMMPEMDGFTFLDHVAQRPELQAIPVVVLTARELSAEEQDRLLVGAQGILRKAGFSLSELERALASLARPAPAP